MKKAVLISLLLAGISTTQAKATYQKPEVSCPVSQAPFSTMGKSIETTLGIQQVIRSNQAKNMANGPQAFLQPNPYQRYFDQNPYASTELKIDLDNFDMEYVLKVR